MASFAQNFLRVFQTDLKLYYIRVQQDFFIQLIDFSCNSFYHFLPVFTMLIKRKIFLKIIPAGLNSSPFLLKNIDTGSVFEDGITVEDTPFDGIIVSAPLERYPEGVYYWMLPQLFTGNQVIH